MTSRMLVPLLAICTILTLAATVSCKRKPSAPQRPADVPSSAVWVGGSDGGVFLDCTPAPNSLYAWSVFNDVTGDVLASGKFAEERRESSNPVQVSDYSAYDGRRILLRSGSLVPTEASRPPGVPDGAALAENGIWVECERKPGADYDCSLFLASNGQKIAGGAYELEGKEEPQLAGIKPKIANRSEIFLVGGAVLRARK